MIEAILSLSGMALFAGLGLGIAAKKFHVESDPIVDTLEKALPATNCGNCGFPGCRPYAEALAEGGIPVNLCTPGGAATVTVLAGLLGVEATPMAEEDGPKVAFINESQCIGCTACIKACPVDAIVGANKQSHTVIVDACTSCEKCVEPCPTDCITMAKKPITLYGWRWEKPAGPNTLH
jgi:electron transport complex protein RnfB